MLSARSISLIFLATFHIFLQRLKSTLVVGTAASLAVYPNRGGMSEGCNFNKECVQFRDANEFQEYGGKRLDKRIIKRRENTVRRSSTGDVLRTLSRICQWSEVPLNKNMPPPLAFASVWSDRIPTLILKYTR